jgi:PAS domain S-box-containing protein
LFERLLRGDVAQYRFEKRYLLKDGQTRWVRIDVSPFPGVEPDEKLIIAVVEDIHEQKLAESRLRESEARNRTLREAIPDLMFLYNAEGQFEDYHAPSDDMLMLPPSQFLHRHYSEVLPLELSVITHKHFESVFKTGESQLFEYTLDLDGKTHFYESRMLPYGEAGVLAIIRDITERKQAEDQLRESEARFRQIADHVDEVFFIRDVPAQKMLYINPAYENIWQRPRAELYENAHAFANYVHKDDLEAVNAIFAQTVFPDKTDLEYRIILPDGSIRWVWGRYFPIHDEQGRAYRLGGLIKDITERKQMEQNNLQLGLQRERIRVISDFIRDASHQFRTPLSVINSKVYLASRIDDHDTRQIQLQGIQEQSDNILKLVESLVAMSRLDSDAALNMLPIDMNQMLQAAYSRHKPASREHDILLALELKSELPMISGDVDELYSALSLLLDNALRYTPPGGRIVIRSYQASESHIAVAIQDTGSGIEAMDLPRIFDRFYRGQIAFSKPGFGLGLAMVKKIVERHGGQMKVESTVGKGSTLTMVLPVRESQPTASVMQSIGY